MLVIATCILQKTPQLAIPTTSRTQNLYIQQQYINKKRIIRCYLPSSPISRLSHSSRTDANSEMTAGNLHSISSRCSGKWARGHPSLFGEERRPDPRERRKSSLRETQMPCDLRTFIYTECFDPTLGTCETHYIQNHLTIDGHDVRKLMAPYRWKTVTLEANGKRSKAFSLAAS